VIGGRAEARAGQLITKSGMQTLNLAGRLSLHELAALLSKASLYIGNDSGPTHLAAALGVPCIALFGPGDVERFAPRGNGVIRILQQKVHCSPCYRTWCSHHTCMRSLTFESVLATAMELLECR
jgi:ADP-heptose:LPS heptosyltransferase